MSEEPNIEKKEKYTIPNPADTLLKIKGKKKLTMMPQMPIMEPIQLYK